MRVCIHHARFADAVANALRAQAPDVDLVVHKDETEDPPEPENIDVLIGFRFPPELGRRMPRLALLQLSGMGHDQLAEFSPLAHVVVADVGGVHARAVAEHACLGLLGLLRGRQGPRIVIIGTGRVGRAVARRARALAMTVVGVARVCRAQRDFDEVRHATELHNVLAGADAVVVALPLSEQTRGMVDARALARLPRGAALVDVSRGGVVDASALAVALASGHVRALLDVFAVEPLPKDSPLWSSAWITPHCAWMTDRHAIDVAAVCADNLARFMAGEAVLNRVAR